MHGDEGRSTHQPASRDSVTRTLRRVLTHLREINRSPSSRDSTSVALERDVHGALGDLNQNALPLVSGRELELEQRLNAVLLARTALEEDARRLVTRLKPYELLVRELVRIETSEPEFGKDDGEALEKVVREMRALVALHEPKDGAHAAVSA